MHCTLAHEQPPSYVSVPLLAFRTPYAHDSIQHLGSGCGYWLGNRARLIYVK